MTSKTKMTLSQMGFDTHTIEAIELLPQFLDGNQYLLEQNDNSRKVNKKIRESISTSQEFEILHKLIIKICEKIDLQCEELDEYNRIVEEAKKQS